MKNSEIPALALVSANSMLAGAQWVLKAVEPVLASLVTLAQVVIGVLTIIWIVQRVKGIKIENKIKALELKEKENNQK